MRHVSGFSGFVRYTQLSDACVGMPMSLPAITAEYDWPGSK